MSRKNQYIDMEYEELKDLYIKSSSELRAMCLEFAREVDANDSYIQGRRKKAILRKISKKMERALLEYRKISFAFGLVDKENHTNVVSGVYSAENGPKSLASMLPRSRKSK